ncbi:protein of unknown function [Mucilaginibacter sp. OK268]|uniref:BT_3987 domain-containing protein n=1 Tax=Mucilaginibacter sp. OK268 TaxID=1881048 RepID=UPI000891A869|nr:DUF1735 domain-containing protein [Mucilaginibacter sp. OK268]SDQ00902.1 protein of unknown function [Mucilaginibacter sp. OK268]
MKTKLYIKTAFVALVSIAGLSSCLKDNQHYVDFAAAKPLVELPAATGVGANGGLFEAVALDISDTPIPINLMVNVAAPKPLSTPLTVKISVDQAALTKYNADNSTSYVLLPADYYTSTFTTTIPANQNSSNIVINIKSSLISPTNTSYVLPLTITDGGGQQISNYKTVLYNVQVKNKYDGTYTASGSRIHPTAGTFTFNYDVAMGTAGATSVSGSALADLKTDLKITVNADNSVTLSSVSQPSVALQPGTVNKYDPATKTFTLNYYYNSAAPRLISETLVKK